MRLQPVVVVLALVGLFAIAVLVGYVGGQTFLAPSPATPRAARPTPVVTEPEQPGPKPATESPARPEPSKPQEPAIVPQSPAMTPEPQPRPVPAPQAGDTGALYRVQVGAFIGKDKAEARAAKLREGGFDAYVTQAGPLYRVQVGAFAVRENAERLAEQLRAAGYEVLITP